MTTKDTKTTKNGLESPGDSSIHQRMDEPQTLVCTKLAGVKTSPLINFNVTRRKDRIKRLVL